MISVSEALRRISATVRPAGRLDRLDYEVALGRVLAQPIVADRDSPPFDKSLVDGFAIDSASLNAAGPSGPPLRVAEVLTAGRTPREKVGPGVAVQIMTGAPIPPGADAVVMIEKCELLGEASSTGQQRMVRVLQPSVKAGQNILRQGQSMQRGERILAPGALFRGVEAGLLHEVGVTKLLTYQRPTVATLATGDELVAPDETPGPGQIRNSNSALLAGLAIAAGGNPLELGIARDKPAVLEEALRKEIDHDFVVITGGVSAGVLDLIPQTLARLGVQEVFHKVNLKPGKPVWFGYLDVREDADDDKSPVKRAHVFGLPGNPVSALVCFLLFVGPAIRLWLRHPHPQPPYVAAHLAEDFSHRGDRPTYWPAIVDYTQFPNYVQPLPWQGSGDLRTLARANGLIQFNAGDKDYPEGSEVIVLLI